MKKNNYSYTYTGLEIALIGMAGRFPAAKDIDDFWKNLKNGHEAVCFFSDEELVNEGLDKNALDNSNYVKANRHIDGKEFFDSSFFEYTPVEAKRMDIQTRLFHECVWHALEDAGYDPNNYQGFIGLFAGADSGLDWQLFSLLSRQDDSLDSFSSGLLRDRDYLTTRISYKLNLNGPSLFVHTACSTSLVAIHVACRSILTGESNIALAGGISINQYSRQGYLYRDGLIRSTDGHCRAFDANAQGTNRGEGCAVVVLKKLQNAVKDRDNIYAVIKGSAVNNDGTRKVGYTAPSIDGQAEVIRAALKIAAVAPESIGYIETHGTGTTIGDPIEIDALKLVFNTTKKKYCGVGSVKTNIGHLGAAAGAAGFVKTVLALKHRQIPPSLHFEKPNPEINLENSPVYINTRLKDWKNENYPLRAGVSSFGVGGTNAHIVLEEAPPLEQAAPGREYPLLMFSAKTSSALDRMTLNLKDFLEVNKDINLADTAYTLQAGRKNFEYRRMLVCKDIGEAVDILSGKQPGRIYSSLLKKTAQPVIFMFSGQGAQYVNMGLGLYLSEKEFRKEIDRGFSIAESLLDFDVKYILYPAGDGQEKEAGNIFDIENTFLILFIFEYALAKLLISWGIKPDAMIGYSFGEYTAACLAGVFSFEDAIKLIIVRAKLMREIPRGIMLSVPLTEEELKPLLSKDLSLSIVNGPSCIVSGTAEAIEKLEEYLKQNRYLSMRLNSAYAIHSFMMDKILDRFEKEVEKIDLHPPGIPYISCVSGNLISAEEAVSPRYWSSHLRKTVRFSDGMRNLLAGNDNAIVIEIGPGQDLSTLVKRSLKEGTNHFVTNTIKNSNQKVPDLKYLMLRIGRLWLQGVEADWHNFYKGEDRRRISLPAYPFEKISYPTGEEIGKLMSGKAALTHPAVTPDISEWFYVPGWSCANGNFAVSPESHEEGTWLIFMNRDGSVERLIEKLYRVKDDIIIVNFGENYRQLNKNSYTIDPSSSKDYETLFKHIKSAGRPPGKIIHLGSITRETGKVMPGCERDRFNDEQVFGFYSLLNIVKALDRNNLLQELELIVVSNNLYEIAKEEQAAPGKATIQGFIRVVPQEYPFIKCRIVDFLLPELEQENSSLYHSLVQELLNSSPNADKVIAYRGNLRLTEEYRVIKEVGRFKDSPQLKQQGAYLITGGLGAVGLQFAEYLSEKVQARLILTTRSFFPQREEWPKQLSVPEENNILYKRIKKLQQLEELGAEVLVVKANAADYQEMEQAVLQAEEKFGKIDGIIHAAGIVRGESFTSIGNINSSLCEEQFETKVDGLYVLEKLFRNRQLDCCWLLSSISTVLGGLTFAAYAAANSFMDVYVKQLNQRSKFKWVSIGWDGMELSKAKIAFNHLFSLHTDNIDRIIVANGGNLYGRIADWIKRDSIIENRETRQGFLTEHSRAGLSTDYIPAKEKIEQELTNIWQDFFGIKNIGIEDDFIELGGDSLKAMTIVSRIHRELDIHIPLTEFFNNFTIKAIAGYVRNSARSKFIAINPVEKREYYECSSAQKRLYALQQFDLLSTAYNFDPVILNLNKDFSIEKLREVFGKIINRHDSFRTSFMIIDGKPVQKITADCDFEIEFYKISKHQEKEIAKLTAAPFDLSKAPLLRVRVLAADGDDRYTLICQQHHIISDGISMNILLEEYMKIAAGELLPALRLQYRDYSNWQKSAAQTGKLKKQEAYWLKEFSGEIPVLNLPTDYPRPTSLGFTGARLNFWLDEAETKGLNEVGSRFDTTLFMNLFAVLNILLFKLTGQEDMVVGAAASGRQHIDLYSIIGMFVNSLAIRSYPQGDKVFKDFLIELKEKTLLSFENQDYQFEDLVEQVSIERDTGRNPLFDVMLGLQNQFENEGAEPEYTAEIIHREDKSTKFDLALDCSEIGRYLTCNLKYSTKLFKKETIIRFTGYFRRIIAQIIENPEVRLSEISILSEAEQQQILREFNDTAAQYPYEKTIHKLFAEQVERTPDNTGLVFKDKWLSYREVNNRANQLARLLAKKGVMADTIVSLVVERSIEMLIGIFAILKSGGAYLPLNPQDPEMRIKKILADSNSGLLLTHYPYVSMFGSVLATIDLGNANLYKKGSSNLSAKGCVKNLAYVIYTSGSTGGPKGVMVEHKNVGNLAFFLYRGIYKRYKRYLRTALVAPYVFDASVQQIFAVLLFGHALYIVPENARRNGALLLDFFKHNKIEISDATPAHLQLISAVLKGDKVSLNLKNVLVGGEALAEKTAVDFLASFRGRAPQITNVYGPAECCVDSTSFEFSKGESRYYGEVPIGRPLANVKTYISDSSGKLHPVRIAGELCISGAGVSRGYLNQSELTGNKFINSPYFPGETIYKSGDLCRWLADGNISFIGRIDQQVKIRGFRIEPGEIENQLLKIAYIEKCVVSVREDNSGQKYLCGYIVLDKEERENSSRTEEIRKREIREKLSQNLQDYMIPSHLVTMDDLPLTAHGKVNRRLLPEPEIKPGEDYTPPGNEIEETLCRVWSEVLGVNPVGIRTNFFEIGGDSIKAIQVSSRLQNYGLKVSLQDLFRHPRIAELGKQVKMIERTKEPVSISGEIPLTPIQHWFFEMGFSGSHHFNQAVMLYSRTGFKEKILRNVLSKIVEHHDVLRAVFKKEEGKIVQLNREPGEDNYDLTVYDLSTNPDVESLIAEKAQQIQGSIYLQAGPLIKCALFKTSSGDHLLIVIHHLVVDGVSWRIILEDLQQGYQQADRGDKITFPGKTDSFKAWSLEQRKYAESPRLLREFPYWRQVGETEVAPLPFDHKIEVDRRRAGNLKYKSVVLSRGMTSKLLKESNRAYNTEINDLLLTALLLSLKEWSGESDILINLEGHGREDIGNGMDISRTVGWFTSQFPVLLKTRSDSDLAYTIKEVKESLRRIPDKGIGYGILRYLTPPEKKPAAANGIEPEISFNYFGEFAADMAGNSIFNFSPIPAGNSVSMEMESLYKLSIDGAVTDGRLKLDFRYNRYEYKEETINRICSYYERYLKDIAAFCSAKEQVEKTPADYGCPRLSLEEFGIIEEHIGRLDGRAEIRHIYPLSPMQEGMLFHSLNTPGSSMYFQQNTISLTGNLEPGILEKSFNAVISKYDILRTLFLSKDLAESQQVVLRERPLRVNFIEIDGLGKEAQEKYIEDYKKRDRQDTFDLSTDHLFRITLIKKSSDEYCLLWNHHHILMDGWCTSIIYSDLLQAYQALKSGNKVDFAEIPQYLSYIDWLEEQDKNEGFSYWENYLMGYEEQGGVSGLKINNEKGGYIHEDFRMILSAELSTKLYELAGKNEATLNTLFLAAWGILLQRYNSSSDCVFGAVVSNRPAEIKGIEKMVGLFINTVPVRVKTFENESFIELLKKLQSESLEIRRYEYLPLAEIQSLSGYRTGLIDHIMAFENFPVYDELKRSGSNLDVGFLIEDLEVYEQTNYEFNIVIYPADYIKVKFIYNRNRYDGDSIRRLSLHFENILKIISENPGVVLPGIDILSKEERKQLLYEFNDNTAAYPEDKTIQQLFEEQVEKNPDNIAAVFADKELTYRNLNRRSNRFALFLRNNGVKPDTIVGIFVAHSLEMVIGIFAILKSGGAYLPIEKTMPLMRIMSILEDCRVDLLLSKSGIVNKYSDTDLKNVNKIPGLSYIPRVEKLNNRYGRGIILLDEFADIPRSEPGNNLPCLNSPGHLAYIIYTSGSTGTPKGVMVKHRSVANLCYWHNRSYEVTVTDHATLSANFGFDASVWELFPYLLKGSTLYIIDDYIKLDIEELNRYFERFCITITFLPTQLCEHFMTLKKDNRSLRVLLTGGDKLQRFYRRNYRLYNNYGPTENTVVATYFPVEIPLENIPIGKPVDNCRVYIFNREGFHLQPPGVPGELYISGAGLARGYLNNPELTTEKFVKAQAASFNCQRPYMSYTSYRSYYYKTGDLCRWLPDGSIEFLGRMDEQVKIRGYRIELGEIESCLLKIAGIREAVVIDLEHEPGQKYLCAYITEDKTRMKERDKENGIDISRLREQLLRYLPAYMVPAFFVKIDKIPLKSNCKVDRKSLRAPEIKKGTDFVLPRSDIEKRVVKIWSEILNVDDKLIGIKSDFFELGGHSLKAVKLLARIHKEFNTKIPMAEFFELGTVEKLSSIIDVVKDKDFDNGIKTKEILI